MRPDRFYASLLPQTLTISKGAFWLSRAVKFMWLSGDKVSGESIAPGNTFTTEKRTSIFSVKSN
ncbi:hypothetical protein AUN00_23090 [Cronobacter sakazakii]|nr:hypothetical protein AUN00_23090 [Cronobacter sakazakii]PUW41342.1 hypothetical protein AUN05_17575 [Cronobacter sakazakii]PUW43551.1 hypothetical protein AUM98_15200 [Cronobacter sakazakii]PUW52995.1 hypothetical protein AUM93_16355 [Cronobacter sakazakii]PUW68814.1 hypothetical protein CBR17_15160 [Cronobacter sakazakii]